MKDDSSLFGIDGDRLDRLVAGALDSSEAEESTRLAASLAMILERPGIQIDHYKLLRVLGEGGMAVVYLAEQTQPVRRQVALKIIKPGMDSKQVLARFEAEQQALALMEHPHIARVYDAGLAPSGRPYFVMEHIKGIPINEHCDKYSLTIEQRLQLFLRACEAVQHAHQKGIIHRDLKPSNILVVIEGHEMIPKVIDFGVARAISQPLTRQTLYTEPGQLIGTPEYMSPEQVALTNQDIDTRTDIYALGVVLYEMLTGVLPFAPTVLRDGGMERLRRVICEEDPQPPSLWLSKTSAEEAAESARRRQTGVRTLQRKLRGDLDWITLKALEKDRRRRYATVEALGEDIRRHLEHEPVAAAPPGVVYRTAKLVRRHRQVVAEAGAAVLLSCVLLWAAQAHILAGRERDHAEALEHERILAEARRLFETRGMPAQGVPAPSADASTMIGPLLNSRHVGPRARLLFAGILVEERRYEEAAAELHRLLQERPEVAGAAHALLASSIWEGKALGAKGLQDVEEHRQKAEQLLPRTAEAYYLRALTALTIRERLDLLAEALRLDPGHYPSRRLRALTYQVSRKYELLKDDALLMTYARPADALGHALRATALHELGAYGEALSWYEAAIALTPADDPGYAELNGRRCEALLRMGQYQRVVADAQECLKIAPGATHIPGASDKYGSLAQEWLRIAPGARVLRFQLFGALTALGRYEQARSALGRDVDSGFYAQAEFRNWSTKYVFDVLDTGSTWHPPDSTPTGGAFLPLLEAEQVYHSLSARARRLIRYGFGGRLAPEGAKIVFCAGVPGRSGIALYDPQSQQTDLLIAPGRDPSWSPDGRHIAFVRDRPVLRFSESAAEPGDSGPTAEEHELWVMNADGAQPRRLARGAGSSSWTPDGKHVYYQSRVDHMLYRISIEDGGAQAVPVLACSSPNPSVSPDGRYVAQSDAGILRITEVASPSCVTEWTAPLHGTRTANWSPDGREISFGGRNSGVWIYDLDREQAARVLRGSVSDVCWSQDKRQLLLGANGDLWVADLAPGIPTIEALGPAQTTEEYFRERIEACNRELAVAPNQFALHCERTVSALWIDYPEASHYLRELELAADRTHDWPYTIYGYIRWFLMRPAFQDRLLPLTVLLARKIAEKEAGYARTFAPVLYQMGQEQEAVRLWRTSEATAPNGSCRYEVGSDSYAIRGYGIDIWETCDDFHFVFKQLHGDGSIIARIDTIENVHPWTKAGVMIRSTLAPDSSNAMLLVTPSGRLAFQYRILGQHGNSTNSVPLPPNSIELPYWVRLSRRGNRFTAQHSSDGITWQDMLYGPDQPVTIEIPMDDAVHIGLAVTSHDFRRAAEARFSRVGTTGHVSPPGAFTESQDICFRPPPSPDTAPSGR